MSSNGKSKAQVDGHRVVFYRSIGWHCDCETFALRGECAHTIKASALLTWGRPLHTVSADTPRH